MKIDLGNFGYQAREAVSARVDRGDPTVQAQAMQNVAEAQLQAAGRENQAWNQVGESLQQFGGNVLSVVDQKVKLDMANAVQDYRAKRQAHLLQLADDASSGKIKSTDIDAAQQKFVDDYKMPEISGMSPMGKQRLDAAFKEVNADFSGRVTQLKQETEKVELSNSLDTNADLIKKNGFDAGEAPSVTAARFDDPAQQQAILKVHGGSAAAWTKKQKNDVYVSFNSRRLSANQDNYNGLTQFIHDLNDPNNPDVAGLDPDQKMQLMNSAQNRKESLEAKARAEANERRQRAEHKNAVGQKYLETIIDLVTTNNIPPSQTMIDNLATVTKGTPLEGTAVSTVLNITKQVQTLNQMSEPQKQQWIDQRKADFAAGRYNSPADIEVFNHIAKSLDASSTAFKADPLTTTAQQQLKTLPTPLPTATFAKVYEGKGTLDDDIELKTWKASRDALSDKAKQRDPSLPSRIFTAPETQQLTNMRNGLNTPEKKLHFDTMVARTFGPKAAKELGATPEEISAAAMKVADPASQGGDYLAVGNSLSKDDKTMFKLGSKAQAGLQTSFNAVAPYIAPSARPQAYTAGEKHYIGWAATNGKPGAMQSADNTGITETKKNTWGNLVAYGAGAVLVPPGRDGTQYVNSLSNHLKALPIDGPFIEAQLRDGSARLVRTNKGLQAVKLNGAPFLSRKDGASPIYITGY